MHPENFTTLYLTYLQSQNRAKATIDWYRTLIRRFEAFAERHGITNWTDVTTALLMDYQKHVAVSLNGNGQAYVVPAQNLHLIVVENLYRYLKTIGNVAMNPAENLQLAKEPKLLPKAVPTIKEISKLLNAPNTQTVLGYRDRTIMELLYSTGIRRAELARLKLQDLDLDHGILVVRQGKGKKDRAVPLGKVAGKYLETYLNGIRPELLHRRNNEDYVFLSISGRPISTSWLSHFLRRYTRRLKLSVSITPHMFRHACATHMIRNRANIRHVQEMLGHAKLETTEKYLHLTITDLKEAHSKYHPREKDE